MLITLFTKSQIDLAFYSKLHRLKANFLIIMLLWTPVIFTLFYFIYLFIIFLNPHLRIYLLILEREEVRGRETLMWERNIDRLVASHACPDWGLNLQPRYVPWLGIEPATFWCMGWCSNQLSHPARVILFIFNSMLWIRFQDLSCNILLLLNSWHS